MSELGHTGESKLTILRGTVGSLSFYEITDYELDILEKGSPTSLLLNFAIFALSVGLSFLATVLSVDFDNVFVYATFLVFSVVGTLCGIVLGAMWYVGRTKTLSICQKIRLRIPTGTSSSSGETPTQQTHEESLT